MTEIPKAPVTRIAKAAGAERISKDAEEKLVEAVEAYANKLSEAAIDLAKHADRKTIQPEDIELALKHFY
ncbi:histone family protein [Methanosphaera cuniculi]|uniref:Histone n=1 Tax=Methanosphaera cuniculi TaxID=1077256 RepID=A0A2A2HBF1_9EURY|nr:histone family protein [Methanosphaera cuniculi]PAV06688.1 histone [Methanosphaera cuniculi]PWL08800.1 histone-like transcription factor (CBF/NF-Y) and archaeal histone [Methanosphaera cuniculi]